MKLIILVMSITSDLPCELIHQCRCICDIQKNGQRRTSCSFSVFDPAQKVGRKVLKNRYNTKSNTGTVLLLLLLEFGSLLIELIIEKEIRETSSKYPVCHVIFLNRHIINDLFDLVCL
jgi:hypothetical protein